MIVDVAIVVALAYAGWWLVALALRGAERLTEPDDPFGSGSTFDRPARARRARFRALLPFLAPWTCWGPMLVAVDSPRTIALCLAAGLVAGAVAAFAVVSWRLDTGGLLLALGAVVQGALLLFLAGLAAEARLEPEALAQRATVVELRRIGRALWESAGAARGPAGAAAPNPALDAAFLLADRAVGWPAIRGFDVGSARLVDATAYPLLDESDVLRLAPEILSETRLVDGWGRRMEVRGWLEARDPSLPRFLVRSAGADGRFDDVYRAGTFDAERIDQDIVWADGAFVREPVHATATRAERSRSGG